MFVSSSVRTVISQVVSLVLAVFLSVAGFAQDASQPTSAPATQQPAAAPTPQQAAAVQTPPQASPTLLTPLPQAPAPQRNAAHPYSDQNYTRGKSPFPRFWQVYTARDVAPANLTNSPRLDQLIREGKMYLSINDAVAMALENNLDIVIQRFNLTTADTDLLRTSAGAAALGVNAGLVQGTPGGTTGSTSAGGTGTSTTGSTGGGAGGTTIGVGGAGSGVAGLVTSTQGEGPTIYSFDPSITGTVSEQHATTPEADLLFTGTSTLVQNTTTANFAYNQGFATGTLMTFDFNNSRVSSNSLYNTLNPTIVPVYTIQFTQHLLQGFGFDPNMRYIRIARNNREIVDVSFRNQVMTTVSQIENIYWDLVNAYESVEVQQKALDLSNKTLADDEKEVKAGTLAPLTAVQAKSAVATAKQNLILAQTNLQLEQLLMKNAITRNMADPILAVAPVIPTDTLNINEPYEVRPVEDLIQEALQNRPEILQARLSLTNSEVSRKSIRNLMKPSLDLYAFYGGTALSGDQNALCTNSSRGCPPPNSIPPTGYVDALQNAFTGYAPDKGIGVNLNIPIRNRQYQADQVRSELEYRQSIVGLQQTENTIRLQVRQAQFAMQQNYAALEAAIAARDYAAENLDAEQKKLVMGASTSTLVLQASSALVQSESNVLAAATNYEKSKVQLDLYTAETISRLGIDINDAEAAKVNHPVHVPGVVTATGHELTTPKLEPLGPNEEAPTMAPQPNQPQPEQSPQPQNPPQMH